MSMMALTRCSSMPSAEIFVKPYGSTHAALERRVAAPAFDNHTLPARDVDGVRREQVHDDLESARVADLDERRAGGNDGFALLKDSQHTAVGGRAYRDAVASVRSRRAGGGGDECGLRALELVIAHLEGCKCGRKRRAPRAKRPLSLVELALGDRAFLDEVERTLVLALCEIELGLGLLDSGPRERGGRLSGADIGARLRFRAGV